MRFLYALLCPLCLSLTAGPLAAAPPIKQIVWFHSDFPPIFILSGPFKGRGTADRREEFLMRQIPSFSHTKVTANVARMQEEMKNQNNICSSSLLKTPEREKNFIFSDALTEILPNGLVTLSSNRTVLEPFLNDRGELRLAELIASEKFRIAVAAGRSYGQTIDASLLAGVGSGKVVPFNASDIFASGLLQVSNNQGADAVMGYAIELSWAILRFHQDSGRFWFIPVEGETALTPVHVACSRSPLGAELIAQVNALIHLGNAQEAAARAYIEWLPADIAQYYERARKPPLAGTRPK